MQSQDSTAYRRTQSNGKENDENITKPVCPNGAGDQKSAEMGYLGTLLALDVSLTSQLALCVDKQSPYGHLRPLMKALEISCHGVPWIAFCVCGILSSHRESTLEFLMNLLMGLLVDLVILATLKAVVRRKRPSHNQMDMFATVSVDQFSFPSGHTTRAVFLFYFIADQLQLHPVLGSTVAMWVIAVCFSRVLLGRHHVLDVACGVVVGYIVFYIVKYLWLSSETCMWLLKTLHEETHL